MERTIKFRSWHFEDGMLYFDFDSFHRDYHDQYGNIMQFTGLTDKNGKEIYEGDILSGVFSIKTGERTSTYKRQKSTFAIYSDMTVIGVCSFIVGCWYFNSNFKYEYKTGFFAGLGATKSEKIANESVTTYSTANEILSKVLNKVEVIGNIHENTQILTP